MTTPAPLVRQVDLRQLAGFARRLVDTLRQTPDVEVLAALRVGVHAHCPQCQLRLFGEDMLVLGSGQAPDPETSAKLHRLAQGFCGRQGCEGLFYEFTFDPVPGVDWEHVLADTLPSVEPGAEEAPPAGAAAEARSRRTRRRVALGLAVLLVLLLVRHLMTGGTIPWIREPRRFTADPSTLPRLGETNVAPPVPAGTPAPRTFRVAPDTERP